ncbi:MAG: UDP-N-acetylmuramoyl-L-alanine--D-glutamate ligase [Alphaproteobacteria bacterium]
MIPVTAFRDRQVAVLGLARTGLSAARALRAGGAEAIGWDDAEPARARAEAAGVTVRDLRRIDWSPIAALVASPGIPLHRPAPHPVVAAARAAGRAVIGDIELFAQALPRARVVGITGTNGKSTTTALVGHILGACGHRVALGGNLGTPALDLEPLPATGLYVLELSSFGIDLTRSLACEVAVLLNITPDHLDRHGDLAGYAASKRRLFAMQRPGQTAVVGVDDDAGRATVADLEAAGRLRVVPVAVGRRVPRGVAVLDGVVRDAIDGADVVVADLAGHAALIGAHNAQNAAAAVAAARAVGVAPGAIGAALASFAGLAHRLETVATIDGVRFVNDSKATNAEAAARALACFETIYWIAGGRAKAGGLAGTEPFWPRVRHAYLIGEAAADFATALEGRVAATRCADLASALARAACDAGRAGRAGAVVLLSPACASFDQFTDFEERGRAFRDAVQRLDRHGGCATETAA